MAGAPPPGLGAARTFGGTAAPAGVWSELDRSASELAVGLWGNVETTARPQRCRRPSGQVTFLSWGLRHGYGR